jgi:hypothetical protein
LKTDELLADLNAMVGCMDKHSQKQLKQSLTQTISALASSYWDSETFPTDAAHIEAVCANTCSSHESSLSRLRDLVKVKNVELKKMVRSLQ